MRILWLSGILVALDQAAKLMVLQTMYRSQTIPLLGDWLSLTYTENPGMAFGITFGPPALITYFSIFATLVILIYLFRIRKGYAPYRYSLALVLGGAFGNIIDRVFYGALFYGEPLFQGRVVDFIHVNVWRGYISESIPILGGKYFALFPIWNIADMAIVLGVVGILIFQKAFHKRLEAGGASVDEMPGLGDVDVEQEARLPEEIVAASGTQAPSGVATGETPFRPQAPPAVDPET